MKTALLFLLLTACAPVVPLGFVTADAGRYRPVIHPQHEGSIFVEVTIPIPPAHRYPSQLVIHSGGYYLPCQWTDGSEESITIRVRSGLAAQGIQVEGHRRGEPCCLERDAEWRME